LNVNVLLFAQARERAGAARLSLVLPAGSRVGDALEALERSHPALAQLRPHLATAVNGELVRGEVVLVEGAELALLPPVSGG
jgi:molybdopterin converting factor subunit 1